MLYFFAPARAYSQSPNRFVAIRVFGPDNQVKANVILGTNKRTCKPTDSYGQTKLELDDYDREGDSLDFIVLAPEGYDIRSQSAPLIPANKQVRVVLKKRAPPASAHDEQRRKLKDAEADEKKAIYEVASLVMRKALLSSRTGNTKRLNALCL